MDVNHTSPAAILRNLFIQLLVLHNADWLGHFSDLVQSRERRESPPTEPSHLVDLIARASKLHGQVTVVIDALDECGYRVDILKLLPRLYKKHGIAVFVTSRKEQDIYEAFSTFPFISLQDHRSNITTDIRTHVCRELQQHPKLFKLPIQLKEEILKTLLEGSDGM